MDETLETVLREVDALPEEDRRRIVRVIGEEVRKAKREAAVAPGRWARFADRMAREAPLLGQSEEFLRQVREFREGFDMRTKPADD